MVFDFCASIVKRKSLIRITKSIFSFLMIFFVVSSLFYVPVSPVSKIEVAEAATATYDFASCAGSNNCDTTNVYASHDDVDIFPFAGVTANRNTHTEMADANYTSISSSNDSRCTSASHCTDPGAGDQAFLWFEQYYTQSVSEISQIDLTVEVALANGSTSGSGAFYVLRDGQAFETNASWMKVGNSQSLNTSDQTITRSIYGDVSAFVNSSTGKITWGFYEDQSTTSLVVDYVKSVVTYNPRTILADGTDGGNSTIAPSASATEINRFSLATTSSTDTVTAMNVVLSPANAYNNIATVDVQTTGGSSKCSSSSWGSDNIVELSSCAISVTTTPTEYKIMITPKTHANMPAVPGASYATKAYVDTITSTNSSAPYLSNLFQNAYGLLDSWQDVSIDSSNQNVYAANNSDFVYKQTAGSGNFASVSGAQGWYGVSVDPSNQNVYAVTSGGDIYKQTAGSGSFNALSQTSRNWLDVSVDSSNQNVYAVVGGGDIYKQTAGSGNFVALGETTREWSGIAVDSSNQNVYAVNWNGDIYKQTAGSGSFAALSQTSRFWYDIAVDPSNQNVYAVVDGGDIYKQTAGTGNFVSIGQPTRQWRGVSVDSSNQNIYASEANGTTANGDIFKLTASDTGATITVDNASPNNATSTSGSAGEGKVTLAWTASNSSDISQSVILRWAASSPGAEVPVEGTAYSAGNTITTATVACVLSSTASQAHSSIVDGTGGTAGCNTSALTGGQAYSYKVFQKDSNGNYDAGVTFSGSPFTPTVSVTTTLGDGTDGGNSTIGPGASATEIDRFSLVTDTSTDTVTGMTVTLAGNASAYTNIATVGVYTTGDVLKCSSSSWGSDNLVELTSCAIGVTTTPTDYVVKITPKTHANMPAVPGASYATTATVTAITVTGSSTGTDTDSATITVDNASPGNVSSTSGSAGDTQVTLNYTNPGDADLSSIVVLRRAGSAVADVPVEGTTYTGGETIGTATVATGCVDTSVTPSAAENCTATGLTNSTVYHFKIFTKDSNGNYDAGVVPTGSPFTPAGTTTAGTTGTQTANLSKNTTEYVGGAFSFSSSDSVNVTGITITESGTIDAATHLDNIKLYYENDTSASYDCASESYGGTETQFGSTDPDGFSAANGTSAFTGSVGISATSTLCIYVVLDVTSGATGGQTIELSIASTSDFSVSAGNKSGTPSIAGTTTIRNNTMLGDGSDPGNSTLAPGASVTDLDAFTLTTDNSTDTITALTVSLSPTSSYNNLSKVEITNGSNTDQCTDVDNPSSLTVNFTGCSLSADTDGESYKVRITPKTHANMPAVPGASYATQGFVSSITSTNPLSEGDSFSGLSQGSLGWWGMAVDSSNQNAYTVVTGGDIYKQTAGSGNFAALSQTSRNWYNIAVDSSNQNVYATVSGGDIYKQTAGSGNFVALSQTSRNWTGISIDSSNQNVYAVVENGDVYKQTGGSGNFVALGHVPRNWNGISVDSSNQNVYAVVYNGVIYKQTAGSGSFIAVGQTSRGWAGIAVDSFNKNVYAVDNDGDIYKQTPVDSSATITVDNASPAGVTSSTATAGNTVVDLAWTNPVDSDFTTSGTVVVLRRATSAVADVPVEGTTYSVGNTIGTATVACVVTGSPPATSCQDTSLSNGTAYHYKIFTQDSRGNYDAGTVPTGSPATPVTSITVSGTIYSDDGSSIFACSGTNLTVRVAVDGVLKTSGTCTTDSGTNYTVSGVTGVATDSVVTVFIDHASNPGAVVTHAADDSSAISANVYVNRVIVRSENATVVSNTNMGAYDSANNPNIDFTESGGNLTVASGNKLIVWTGDTFTPGGTVATTSASTSGNPDGDIVIQSGATLSMGTNALSVGGDFTNSGTFSYGGGQTTTFTATGSGFTIEDGTANFDTVVMNGSGGTWTTQSALTIAGNLTITAGNLTVGATDITVTGNTSITGTLTLSSSTGTKTFTGNVTVNASGAWNNSGNAAVGLAGNLTNNQTFTAGSGVYTMSGTSKSISGTVAIPSLTVSGTISNTDTLTVSTALAGTGTLTNSATGTLNIGQASEPLASGTLTASASGNIVNYTGASPNCKVTTYDTLNFTGSGTVTCAVTTVTNDVALSGTVSWTTGANLAITDALTVSNGTTLTQGSFTLGVGGVMTVGGGSTGTFVGSSSALNLSGNVTINSGATWTKGSGTVTFKKGSTQTLTDSTASKQDLGTVAVSSSGGAANIALNQTIAKQNFDSTGTSINMSFGTAPAAGSLVVVELFTWDGDISIDSITDNQGNGNYTIQKSTATGQQQAVIAYKENVSSSGTFTITVNGITAGSYVTGGAQSFTGIATSTPADQSGSAADAYPQDTDATVSTSGSTSQADELVVAVAAVSHATTDNGLAAPASSGYSNAFREINFQAHAAGSVDYKIVSSAGVQSASWSHNDVTSAHGWTATILTFKAAESGGSNTTLSLATSAKMTKLTVNASQAFTHNGSTTLTLTGSGQTSSRPLINNGTFTQSTGTIEYTGTSATDISNVTSDNITYNTLSLLPAGIVTYTLGTASSQTFTVGGTLTVGNGANALTLDGTTYNPTTNLGKLSIAGSAIFNAPTANVKLTGSGTGGSRPLINSGTFTQGSSTVEYVGTSATEISNLTSDGVTYNNLTMDPAGTVTYTLGTASSQTMQVNGVLIVGNGSNAVTVNADTYDPALDLRGNTTLSLASIYTKGSGTTTFKKGSTQTLTDSTASKQDLGTVVVAVNGTPTTLSLASSVKMTKLTINSSQIFDVNGANTLTLTGSGTGGSRPLINSSGTFTQGSGTVEYTGTSATEISNLTSDNIIYNNLSLIPAGAVTYTLGTASTQTMQVNGVLTMGNGSDAVTVTAATHNPALDLRGNVTLALQSIYTKGSGTTTFNKGDVQTLTDSTASKQDLGTVVVAPLSSDFSYRSAIVIDQTAVPGDQTNFPVLISGTYDGTGGEPDLRTTGNQGNVEDGQGDDIGFYTNSNCSSGKMDWEVETYSASSGAVNYWVEVPSLSGSVDTTFYMCYGNASVTTDQSNATGVWDTNYRGVYHLPNGTTLSADDSTTNDNNGTISGVAAAAGKVDGTSNFDTSTDTITIGTSPLPSGNSQYSIEVWANFNDSSARRKITNWGNDQGATRQMVSFGINPDEIIHIDHFGDDYDTDTSITNGVWTHLAVTYDGTTDRVYKNGVEVDSHNPAAPLNVTFGTARIGSWFTSEYPNGKLDEFRISNTRRSANWIETSYNNQNDPSSFYSTGAETPAGVDTTLSLATSAKMTKLTVNSSQTFTHNGSTTLTLTGSGQTSSRPLQNSGTFTQSTGTIEYTGTSATDISNVTSDNITYNNLSLIPAGTVTYTLGTANSQTFTTTGTLTVGNNSNALTLAGNTYNPTTSLGNLDIQTGSAFTVPTSLSLTGNLTIDGTFTHNSGTLTLAPTTGTTIDGSSNTTFNNFTLSANNGGGKTLQFKDGNTYTFSGAFEARGESGNILAISSTSNGNQWDATFNSTAVVTRASIKDSGCSGGNNVSLTHTNVNLGNNDSCWRFLSLSGGGVGQGDVEPPASPPGGSQGGGGGSPGGGGQGGEPPPPPPPPQGGGGGSPGGGGGEDSGFLYESNLASIGEAPITPGIFLRLLFSAIF